MFLAKFLKQDARSMILNALFLLILLCIIAWARGAISNLSELFSSLIFLAPMTLGTVTFFRILIWLVVAQRYAKSHATSPFDEVYENFRNVVRTKW